MRAAAAAGRADYDHSGLITLLEDLADFRVSTGTPIQDRSDGDVRN